MSASIVMEYEGLTKERLKAIARKVGYCGFNTIATHIQVQLLNTDGEMKVEDMSEDRTDLQPVQPNSIYLKCGLLDSASNYPGKGDRTLLATRRNTAPVMQLANLEKIRSKELAPPIQHILPTETPIEDEYEIFDLSIQKDIIFHNPSGGEEIGWYNKTANILWLSDLVHNPLRAEYLLDRAVSAVYELQRCGTLDVITPIYDKFAKELEGKGMSDVVFWWTGFESPSDGAYLDGVLSDPKKFIKDELKELINGGADIFFLRSLLQLEKVSLTLEKCKGKLSCVDDGKELKVPSHTTLAEQTDILEKFVSDFIKKHAEEFHRLANKALSEKRIK